MKQKTDPSELALQGMPRCQSCPAMMGVAPKEMAPVTIYPMVKARKTLPPQCCLRLEKSLQLVYHQEEAIFFEKTLANKCTAFVENTCSTSNGQATRHKCAWLFVKGPRSVYPRGGT
jgi:hypothetical protein